MDNAHERMPHILTALQESDADVICLQEVWSLADRAVLNKALSEKFEDIYMSPVYQTTTRSRPSCKPWELFGNGKFLSCMTSRCKGLNGDELTDCLLGRCGGSLTRLMESNRECATALMAKVGKNPFISVLQLINPFYRSGVYAYRGSNGLVLASKLPLKDKEVLDFSDISTLNRRQALVATVDLGGEDLQVMCTHLSANLKVPYTGISRDWADENYTQALRLLEKSSEAEKSVVMGDFNCGLAGPEGGLSTEFPQTCELLEQYFHDPAAGLGQCTHCSSNTLNEEGSANTYIDHIYTKGVLGSAPEIKYVERVIIDDGRRSKETNLSDHYGVQVTID